MNIKNGWLQEADIVESPNFNLRPSNTPVDMVVIHNISLPPEEYDNDYVELFFQNKLPIGEHPYFEEIKTLEVSAHFLIKRAGEIIQFVSTENRAWHAGKSSFCGRDSCNDFSIGIELQGSDNTPYTSEQYNSLKKLIDALKVYYPLISNQNIRGHEHIAPGRKTDPGPAFDWDYFYSLLA